MNRPQSFTDLLALHSVERGQHVAYYDRDRPLTYRELDEQSRRLASGLSATGVREGDRVAVWLPNCHAWLLAFLACARLGATVFAVNTRFREREVEDILERGRIDWLVLWPDFKGIVFAEILGGVPDACLERLQGFVCYSETANQVEGGSLRGKPSYRFSDLLIHENGAASELPTDLGERGAIAFTTSGTTALPKFVLHRQRTLIDHGATIAQAFGYDEHASILVSTPFCGAFGFATLIGGLVHGATLVSEPVFDPASAAAAVDAHSVTHTFANNESIVKIIEAAGEDTDFSSVRVFGFASFSPAIGELIAKANSKGLALCGLYGSSELNALLAAQPFAPQEADAALQHMPGGRLVDPQARVRARNPDTGAVQPHGQSGELEIRAASTMVGYLDQPEETAKAFTADGYFRTGDLGFTVSDRHFVFEARIGDSLRLSGFLASPAEIEAIVDTLPGIAASQVVGGSMGGRLVPFAFVVLQPGAEADEHKWREICKKRMAGFKIPVGFRAVDEFPTVSSANATKIQRGKLREMADDFLKSAAAVAP